MNLAIDEAKIKSDFAELLKAYKISPNDENPQLLKLAYDLYYDFVEVINNANTQKAQISQIVDYTIGKNALSKSPKMLQDTKQNLAQLLQSSENGFMDAYSKDPNKSFLTINFILNRLNLALTKIDSVARQSI
ncbi:hypothetical protein [Campylobacter hyointestinalis]|uniref:Uncharacterized protein n=1 Tax=Campylobacter hyointestinalis subsp. hyointestinalis TaxID=91352 RepID=A0A855NBT0_CAMHY|nr:hypothetical protein [Campylobacter hyointestinalis]KEA44002.1 hypothetical protein CR67_05975 [Campylobacter hyointestinalis subsp. hyointestinalis]PPB57796.1 hypothetical protein CDQ70_05850 [Campylobacter hyointestinalis subsp. hyointestinalis]PPB61716.1 hypothetical protein CDQ74_08190 [Campylobacter hyointestinalis subsp. hyointestinalis]PPB72237.1 hypothetical protein CDQ78_04735 [Campylobacter hyointestinalis subsp. hyointestinalis]QKF56534.1 hypothetical protein CHHT_1742 [Campyloba